MAVSQLMSSTMQKSVAGFSSSFPQPRERWNAKPSYGADLISRSIPKASGADQKASRLCSVASLRLGSHGNGVREAASQRRITRSGGLKTIMKDSSQSLAESHQELLSAAPARAVTPIGCTKTGIHTTCQLEPSPSPSSSSAAESAGQVNLKSQGSSSNSSHRSTNTTIASGSSAEVACSTVLFKSAMSAAAAASLLLALPLTPLPADAAIYTREYAETRGQASEAVGLLGQLPAEAPSIADVHPTSDLTSADVASADVASADVDVASSDNEGPVTFLFPASTLEEIGKVQRTLIEAWGIVRETYVDPSFNGQDWDKKLESVIGSTLDATSAGEAFDVVRGMLASLNDPFTRIISPQEYEAFRIGSDGALEGVGLLIASDPDTGRLVVLSPIDGSPAARAGILPGDELLEIDNEALTGLNGQQAADLLRGQAGTSVTLTVRPAASDSNETSTQAGSPRQVVLQRESISLSPVFATLLPHDTPTGEQLQTGYIRLSAFSGNAADEMQKAIEQLEADGASDYILDLRNNPGGLVKSGFEIALMWLQGTNTLVNTIDRFGYSQSIYIKDNEPLTQKPLAVLVNHSSASASEILAGALRDNGRATLVGDTTYGKGKIQSVFELSDGSALFVTVAKYLSPARFEIDQIGVIPDNSCQLLSAANDGALSKGKLNDALLEKRFPLKRLQQASLPSFGETINSAIFVDDDIQDTLQADSCVLTAEHLLEMDL